MAALERLGQKNKRRKWEMNINAISETHAGLFFYIAELN